MNPKFICFFKEENPSGNAVFGTSCERPGKTTVGQDIRDRFSCAVEAFSRRNVSGSGQHAEQSRHRSEDMGSSKDVQPDSEKGHTSRNGNSSKRAAVSSGDATDDRSSRLVWSTGRLSTTQRSGVEPKSSSFLRAAKDPLRSFDFLSIRK